VNNLHQQIQKIFEEVRTKWEKVSFNEKDFPEICLNALANPTDYNMEQILEFTNLKELPLQSYPNDEFGEVPFTIFRHEKFFIDIYMWNIHNTSIHDHNFTGAFKLLNGHSKKINFEFIIEKEITPNFFKGELKSFGTVDLNPGDREIILPYEITHLTNPSVTLLIRTNGHERNLNLYNKKFAYQFIRSHSSFQHKFNCIKMIYSYGESNSTESLKTLVKRLDTQGLFLLLLAYININPFQISAENVARMYQDFKILSEDGTLPQWFTEFLSLEIEAREKEIRFQKMKLFGII
jgi:hypothetical protein